MKDVKDAIFEIKESQIRMELDLKYHIKRTDILESMVKPLHKMYNFIKYLIVLLTTLGGLMGAYLKLWGK
jgi:hypothetical protein